jgi:hypothetical protein
MSELMLVMAWGSYLIRRLPIWLRRSVFIPVGLVMLLGPPAVTMLSLGHPSRDRLVDALMLYLLRRLPENPVALVVLGVIAVAAMFRFLEKLTAEAEWPELFSQAPALTLN